VQPAVVVARPRRGQFLEPHAKLDLRIRWLAVALRGTLKAGGRACPALVDAIGFLQMACDLPPSGGLHH
jgi:hypothetical protein